MLSPLIEEYIQWEPRSKIELVNGQLIIGKSLIHSRLLLSQILRGWGAEAATALAPESLWWQALTSAFDAPVADFHEIDTSALQVWASSIAYEPEVPQLLSQWNWKRSQVQQALYMAFFRLEFEGKKLGRTIGGGFVNRLGNNGFMPDILFFRQQGTHHLYEYYLDGPAELVVEFVSPGCEVHDEQVKRSHYQAAGVLEYWLIYTEQENIEFWRLVDGVYQRQYPDKTGRYAISSSPGLTFIPARLWLSEEEHSYSSIVDLFEIATDAPSVDSIPYRKDGISWNHAPTQFPSSLEPVPIAFEDYLYWCPEAKFEFAEGRPDIGGREGIRGLLGMLLMTFGLMDAVKLLHPQQWVEALIQTRIAIQADQHRKTQWWHLAEMAAAQLRGQFGVRRLAVAGDLIKPEPLNFWSELFLLAWDLPVNHETGRELYQLIWNISSNPNIYFFEADGTLSPLEQRVFSAGFIEI